MSYRGNRMAVVAAAAAAARAGEPFALNYLTDANDLTTQTIFTFSSVNFGTVAGNRKIIVAIGARKANEPGTLSSVTIGGQAATISVQQQNLGGGNNTTVAIAIAEVPLGASGDIVVTFSTDYLRCGIGVWNAFDIDATAHDTGSDNAATAPTVQQSLPAGGGVMIGVSGQRLNATCAWTGIDEDLDENLHPNFSYSAASKLFNDSQTNLDITATWSSAGDAALAVAAFKKS